MAKNVFELNQKHFCVTVIKRNFLDELDKVTFWSNYPDLYDISNTMPHIRFPV